VSRRKSSDRKEWEEIGMQRAQEMRGALGLGLGPISDVFNVIQQQGILLIRYPAEVDELPAFYAEIQEFPIIFINSNEVLGRQIFSAAHELCHFFYDRQNLKFFLCNPGSQQEEDNRTEIIADAFAGEFLVPKTGLKAVFHKCFGYPRMITETHVIKMQQYYKVSYAAMLFSLFKAGIITAPTYGKLKKLGALDNSEQLRLALKRNGYGTELIESTSPQYPQQFYDAIVENFENGLISYGKLEDLLGKWGRTPEEFGFERYEL
jgi:Zn-dependent peptidase ImmA (M78 family)